jgi:DNA-binding CsgD family transcriptional regulator
MPSYDPGQFTIRKIENQQKEPSAASYDPSQLTVREVDVLRQVLRGYTNKQIGRMLKIPDQTIRNHVSSIMKKLHGKDRTHAVVIALRRGLISLEDAQPAPREPRKLLNVQEKIEIYVRQSSPPPSLGGLKSRDEATGKIYFTLDDLEKEATL